MEKTLFTAYGRATPHYAGLFPVLKDVPIDHVFIESSAGENWSLFGNRDTVSSSTLPVGTAEINLEWFKQVHGEGPQIAGISVYVTGTCHNAANRLLALGHGNVSGAQGHALVLLVYGQYGFGVKEFVGVVESTARSLDVPEADVVAVVRDIRGNCESELAVLERDFDKRLGSHLSEVSGAKRNALRDKYLEYHEKRERVYSETPSNPGAEAFQRDYVSRVSHLISEYLHDCHDTVGEELWTNSLRLPSVDVAMAFLTGYRPT